MHQQQKDPSKLNLKKTTSYPIQGEIARQNLDQRRSLGMVLQQPHPLAQSEPLVHYQNSEQWPSTRQQFGSSEPMDMSPSLTELETTHNPYERSVFLQNLEQQRNMPRTTQPLFTLHPSSVMSQIHSHNSNAGGINSRGHYTHSYLRGAGSGGPDNLQDSSSFAELSLTNSVEASSQYQSSFDGQLSALHNLIALDRRSPRGELVASRSHDSGEMAARRRRAVFLESGQRTDSELWEFLEDIEPFDPNLSGQYHLHQQMDPRHNVGAPRYASQFSPNSSDQFKRLSVVGTSNEHPLAKQDKFSHFPLSRSILQSAGSFLQGGPRGCFTSGAPPQAPKTLELTSKPMTASDHVKMSMDHSGISEPVQMKYEMPVLASPSAASLGLYNPCVYNHKRRSLNNIHTPSGDDSWSVSSGDSSCANSPCVPSPAAFAHQPPRCQMTPNAGTLSL